MIEPGLVSVTFRQLDPNEVIGLAVANGLHAIEWGGDVHVPVGHLETARHVRGLTEQAGLRVASYGSYYRAGDDEPGHFTQVLDTAVALGAPRIRVWAGRRSPAEATQAEHTRVVAALRDAVREAMARGIRTAVEFHHGTLTETVESTKDLLSEVPGLWTYWQPAPGCLLDTATAEVASLADRLAAVHVFAWAPDGTRLPLQRYAPLWQSVLAELSRRDGAAHDVEAMLEFVSDDDPAELPADAASLTSWVPR